MEKIPYSKFKHGQKVTCKIYGEQIDDALISIDEDGSVYVCQNKKDGGTAENKLVYTYSWRLFFKSKLLEESSPVTDIIFLDRSIEYVQEGDVVYYYGKKVKALGRCGDVVFLSLTNHYLYGQAVTIDQLKASGCTIQQDTPPTLTEVTLQEVADKMGVPVEQLRIKE